MAEDGSSSSVSLSTTCSICLEPVIENSRLRSTARLQCGHVFHLSCIGSEFNMRGVMQCPNCRAIENGEWRFANGDSEDDEDHYHFVVMNPSRHEWCPRSGWLEGPSSFEERELPSPVYNGTNEQLENFADFNHPLNGPPLPRGISVMSVRHAVDGHDHNRDRHAMDVHDHHWDRHAMDVHDHNWDHQTPFTPMSDHINGPNQGSIPSATQRFVRTDSNGIPRAGSFAHLALLGRGPNAGIQDSVFSSVGVPYPGVPAHDRFRDMWQQPSRNTPSPAVRASILSGLRRSNGSRGLIPVGFPASSPDQTGFSNLVHSSGSLNPNLQLLVHHHHAWERNGIASSEVVPGDRDPGRVPFHLADSGSDHGSRPNSPWQRFLSETLAPENQTEDSTFPETNTASRTYPFM